MKNQSPENLWRELQQSTISHAWDCDCGDCAKRLELGREISAEREREFQARKVRLSEHNDAPYMPNRTERKRQRIGNVVI